VTRAELQKLTRIRLTEARILLRNGCYEGAYYLAGYAVECAIKACIAKKVRRFEFPDKKLAVESYTHDLKKLLGAAELKPYHDAALESDLIFKEHGQVVAEWSEQRRYELYVKRKTAERFYCGIVARRHGVLAWLKQYW
jgi:HEPN domain-containing protein